MKQGRIVIVTGAPGTGKTAVAALLANESIFAKSVDLCMDDFYHSLCKGAIPPYLPESQSQNRIVMEALLGAAKCYASGGYDVIVDGVIGPWFLSPWLEAVQDGYAVHYFILRASKEETMRRALQRSKLDWKTNAALVETMWVQFQYLERYEPNVIDTSDASIEETVFLIKEKVEKGLHLLLS